MGGDSKGFMGMGSLLLGGSNSAQQGGSLSDLAQHQMHAQMYAQQAAMMQQANAQLHRAAGLGGGYYDDYAQMVRGLPDPREAAKKCPPPKPADAPYSKKAMMMKARYEDIAEYMKAPPPPPPSNMDKLRAEVAAWTRRAA